jgi:transcriptional regulator with XRE-family HTH domain
MDYYTASDSAILEELGKRIRGLRLRKNITQEALAGRALIAVGTLKSLEAGKGTTLSTLVAVLRELGALDQLDQFIPPVTISPIRLAEASAKVTGTARARARATVRKGKKHERDD